MDQAIWGQILLAFTTGFISLTTTIVGFVLWRSRVNLNRRLEKERTDHVLVLEQERAKHELEKKQFEAAAQERVLAAEQDIRSIASQQAAIASQQLVLTQLLELLRDAGKRTDEKDTRDRAVLGQLLDASRESTDALKNLVRDMDSVKTNLGEHTRAFDALSQVMSSLPTLLDTRTNSIAEVVKDMVTRFDKVLNGLDTAKEQLLADLIVAIRDIFLQIQQSQPAPLASNLTEGTS